MREIDREIRELGSTRPPTAAEIESARNDLLLGMPATLQGNGGALSLYRSVFENGLAAEGLCQLLISARMRSYEAGAVASLAGIAGLLSRSAAWIIEIDKRCLRPKLERTYSIKMGVTPGS